MKADYQIVSVAVPAPLYQTYDYLLTHPGSRVGTSDAASALVGRRVHIEFGYRKLVGIILATQDAGETAQELKEASLFEGEAPAIQGDMLQLLRWAAVYYCHPIGDCLNSALPSLARKGRPLPDLHSRKWYRSDKPFEGPGNASHQRQILELAASHPGGIWEDGLKLVGATPKQLKMLEEKGYLQHKMLNNHEATNPEATATERLELNQAQSKAFEHLSRLSNFAPALLEGVTGSGKTEVYIHLVEKQLTLGKQALILIPEINLSPQTFARFQRQLSCTVALVHSGLGEKDKYRAWMMAKSGHAKVIIGTRSAIFTPFKTLGLIVVDEEHDSSYKQMDGFKYSARDLAVKRAQLENCPIILGTATPSLETLHNALRDHYDWVKLDARAGLGELPKIALIDIKSRPLVDGCSTLLTQTIRKTLDAGDQVLVFQNRRGFAPTLICDSCGQIVQCPHCDARLTVHSQPAHMHCHHCDFKTAIPNRCDECKSQYFSAIGAGTERIEASLSHQFPDARLIRIDRDTIKSQKSLNDAIKLINSGEPAIIVGTQMLTKGHDFHQVALVAVLDADGLFFSSDFRSIERGAQQLIQIAGRTGRGSKKGHVLIQTRLPEHPLFEHVLAHDYRRCALQELEERKQCLLPPHSKMISIRAESGKEGMAIRGLEKFQHYLQQQVSWHDSTQFIGPIEATMPRKKGIFRAYLTILNEDPTERLRLQRALPQALATTKARGVRFSIDVDPLEYM